MLVLALTVTDWTAIVGSLISVSTVVGLFWNWARKQSENAEQTGAALRVELRDENKDLRQENQEQYDRIRELGYERDILEAELRKSYRYQDDLIEGVRRYCLPAITQRLPQPPERLLLAPIHDLEQTPLP